MQQPDDDSEVSHVVTQQMLALLWKFEDHSIKIPQLKTHQKKNEGSSDACKPADISLFQWHAAPLYQHQAVCQCQMQ
eukprot:scaffold65113_cov18-Tisochrysis_lutea.AAC.1